VGKKGRLAGKRVLITGGSRGLGLAMASLCAKNGASLFLCARDGQELERARTGHLPSEADVETCVCDLTEPAQIHRMIRAATGGGRRIDVLINNAGVMDVGPLEAMSADVFESAFAVNTMGMIRVTLAALPHMPRGSRIINVTSIGGAVAVPHLLPYTVSKFGALGFSLGLDAELASRRISVTSVLPGLMRTGSFVQAYFRGNARKEFGWFALGATLPGLTVSAQSAARRILLAGLRRRRFAVIGPQARALRQLYQLFPRPMLALMRGVARLLPAAERRRHLRPVQGHQLRRGRGLRRGGITRLGDRAGDRLNQNAA
jgi:short-subunit dehydrogenase